jgi:hypothetical protein
MESENVEPLFVGGGKVVAPARELRPSHRREKGVDVASVNGEEEQCGKEEKTDFQSRHELPEKGRVDGLLIVVAPKVGAVGVKEDGNEARALPEDQSASPIEAA